MITRKKAYTATLAVERLAQLAERGSELFAKTPKAGRLVFGEIVHLDGRNGIVGIEFVRGKPVPRFYEIAPVARRVRRKRSTMRVAA